ncbi:MAG: hypothetical protein ACR2PW_04800 [Gammaproteobacteria bacterium]
MAILDQDLEISSTPSDYEFASGTLLIKSPDDGPFNDIRLTANVQGPLITGQAVLSTTLAARVSTNSALVRLASVSGVQTSHYLNVDANLSQQRNGTPPDYTGDQIDQGFHGSVTGIDGLNNIITLDRPHLWSFAPDLALTYVADGSRTRFHYRVVRRPKSQIEVRVDDVLQTEGVDFDFAAVSGSADLEANPESTGIYIDFTSAPANNAKVKLNVTSDVSVTVRRSGLLTMENVRIVSNGTDYQQKSVWRDRLKGSVYRNIEFIDRNIPMTGSRPAVGVQYIEQLGVDTEVDGFEMNGGGYAFYVRGAGFAERNGVAFDVYERNQNWFSATDNTSENIECVNPATSFGGHGGHGVTIRRHKVVDGDMHIRSPGVNVDGLLCWAKEEADSIFSLGWGNKAAGHESELEDSRDDPATMVMNYGFSSSATNWLVRQDAAREANLNILPASTVTLTDVDLGGKDGAIDVDADGTTTVPYRVNTLTATNVKCRQLNCRLVLAATITNPELEELRLRTLAGQVGGVTVTGGSADGTDRVAAGDWVIDDDETSTPSVARVFNGFAMTRPGAAGPTSNADADVLALYEYTNTTLNGVEV